MVLPKLEEIKKRRQALNLSQEYLANKAHVTRVLISQIERNHHSPSYATVDRIFTILETEENEVMKKGMTAGEICVPRPGTIKKQLVTVSSHNTIKTAESKMGSDGEISQLPVIDKGECIGLVTSQSILKKPPGAKIVKDAMISRPPTISEDTQITIQIKSLLDNSPCILVSDKKTGKIKGIIVAWDIIHRE
jgi:predicted transcriptional regulator|tara:strand:+ start:196 stop:771 length:576 start_codon:yes stop_codon:yes gene_type:complete